MKKSLIIVSLLLVMSGCALKINKLDNVTEVRLILGDNNSVLFDADVSFDGGIELSISSNAPEKIVETCQESVSWVSRVIGFAFNLAFKLWPIL